MNHSGPSVLSRTPSPADHTQAGESSAAKTEPRSLSGSLLAFPTWLYDKAGAAWTRATSLWKPSKAQPTGSNLSSSSEFESDQTASPEVERPEDKPRPASSCESPNSSQLSRRSSWGRLVEDALRGVEDLEGSRLFDAIAPLSKEQQASLLAQFLQAGYDGND